MERYFFDVEDGHLTMDDDGRDLAGADAVAAAAMSTLLEIARFEVVANNERELSVTVWNEAGDPIYRAAVTVKAGWLVGADRSLNTFRDHSGSGLQ
ncbi:hypothetical protein MKK58_02955 [Methylobacterium sp. J-078]|uniref:DUF6894 family protein n=1 Tax=Methylobacterium sp. J-078 TaxID=2836657 RepID=UPI001FBAEA04|nr:hypothetical protein [Methylobacterium sp. J-078]MCJ2043502.1 hypothetical protein [Methylobacterium sp. J-078]